MERRRLTRRRARKPKVRLIESQLLFKHLPARDDKRFDTPFVRLVYPDNGETGLELTPREILILARETLILGVVDKKDCLLRVVLTASLQAVFRIIRGLRRPVMPASFISRAHQAKGAKKWVKRHDRAKGGLASGVRQIATAVRSADERQTIAMISALEHQGRAERRRAEQLARRRALELKKAFELKKAA